MSSGSGLARLFSPASVAVVGASGNPAAIGGQPIKHLIEHGFRGDIYPVNPKYGEIAGLRCYPELGALPVVPDVVIVAVAARLVPAVLAAAAELGVPAAIVFSSGFAETGEDGRAAQSALATQARAAGLTIIGPNCQGLINVAEDIPLGFGAPYGYRYRPGGLGLVSQSGAFGNSILRILNDEGVGVHYYISTGNEAATTSLDCYRYFIDAPGVQAVAGYVEGFQDARRLRLIARQALAARKPMVLWKVGNTREGGRAAASHTANLSGDAAYYQAAFRQYGIIGANDIGDMADCLRALAGKRYPGENRQVAILSLSGGAGIVMADRCVEQELTLSTFSPVTRERLAEVLPGFGSTANPVDMTAGVLNDPATFSQVLRAVLADPAVGMLGLCLAALSGPSSLAVAREVVALHQQSGVPILVAWNGRREDNQEAYRLYEQAGIPLYLSPARCARGLGALGQYGAALARQHGHAAGKKEAAREQQVAVASPVDRERAVALTEYQGKQWLAQHGLPVTRHRLAVDADQAAAFAAELSYPLVMKMSSAQVLHKSDIGGVRVGLRDERSVRQAFDDLRRLTRQQAPDSPFEGVLLEEMVEGGVEVILGAVNDPAFGPVIMFGAGGIHAEVFGDVAFRLAPMSRADARALIDETKVSRLLAGVRGRPPLDREALLDAILALADLAVSEVASFSEIDINPLVVLPKGQGVKALDALVLRVGGWQ